MQVSENNTTFFSSGKGMHGCSFYLFFILSCYFLLCFYTLKFYLVFMYINWEQLMFMCYCSSTHEISQLTSAYKWVIFRGSSPLISQTLIVVISCWVLVFSSCRTATKDNFLLSFGFSSVSLALLDMILYCRAYVFSSLLTDV